MTKNNEGITFIRVDEKPYKKTRILQRIFPGFSFYSVLTETRQLTGKK